MYGLLFVVNFICKVGKNISQVGLNINLAREQIFLQLSVLF